MALVPAVAVTRTKKAEMGLVTPAETDPPETSPPPRATRPLPLATPGPENLFGPDVKQSQALYRNKAL